MGAGRGLRRVATVRGMAPYPRCRILAIIGSGETSPTMVTVHRDLVSRLGRSSPQAIMLATPYAFQENAADVSARAQRYFADSVGLRVRAAAGTSPRADPGMAPPLIGGDEEDETRQATGIRAADWVFAGPGSPSYALAHWQAGPVAAGLRDRVLAGDGLTVLASAAAATAGRFTLPVYEIYKAGGAPHWLSGLDLLGPVGLTVAVIPHYDNAEGGRYDTRYCYLGERRLAVMERELPADAAVLGVDEHTAVLIDLRTDDIEIRGRGGVTVRRAGDGVVLPAGTRLSVPDLRDLVQGIRRATGGAGASAARGEAGRADATGDAGATRGAGSREAGGGDDQDAEVCGAGEMLALPLPEIMAAAERRFEAAAGARDADAMVGLILELETAIGQWEADTDEDQGTEQARALCGRAAPRAADRAARRGQFRRRRRHQGSAGRRRARRQRHAGRHPLATDRQDLTRERLTWALHLAHVRAGLEPAGEGRTTLKARQAWPNEGGREEPDSCPA